MVLQVTVAREPAVDRSRTTQQPAVRPAVDRFLEAARARGLEPMPLQVRAVESPFLMAGERARRLVEVRWRQRLTFRFGKRTFSWTLPRAGTFYQLKPQEMVLPVQTQTKYDQSQTLPEVEEHAVFVERADPILAVRVEGEWFELDRWTRPVQLRHGGRFEWA